ncbi:hypothetical protein RB599_008834 [Gaeumannomyces hyphopodioides]
MDYERPSGSAKVQVALLLIPSAKTLRGVKNARPPLLINPAGREARAHPGATFAKLFPDRVGRVAIDGIVNACEAVGGPHQTDSLHDTDAGLSDIFKLCFEAGTRCLFRWGSDAGPADAEARFWALLDRLDRDPPVFVYPTNSSYPPTPVVVTSDLVKGAVFSGLYNPIDFAYGVDMMLSNLHDGKAELIGDRFRVLEPPSLCDPSTLPTWSLPDDGRTAVSCGDKREPINDTMADIQAKFERHAATSRFADVWMGVGVDTECNQWGILSTSQSRPSPWDPSQDDNVTETAFPLLVLSNTHDPATPLKSGLRVATAFKGAGFVEQRCGGHVSMAATSAETYLVLFLCT